MQIFLTIVSGVAVFVFGQAILHFLFEPIREFNQQRADTSFLLLFHQAKITNASNANPNAQKKMKKMAAALISTMRQIPFYQFMASLRLFGLPPKKDIFQAARELNGIAHSMVTSEQDQESAVNNVKALEKIARLLRIQTGYS